ncbi:MAG TPA: PIN domain-containing protein [Thermoanaerobaculia bacterium]|nr:PIN domain-containing protein [Thermoanaerobaculia bacterium]
MIARSFLDTNVLVYAAAGRGADESKRLRALELIMSEEFGLSAQVLQEFYVTVTRKLRSPLSPETAIEWIEQLDAFPQVPIDASLVKVAIENSVRYRISYWDAAIVAAAERLGARTLYSEDLSDGQMYGSVTVLNPFVDTA